VKIGMIGTGATGKTTTAQLVEAAIPEAYVPGVARLVFAEAGIREGQQRFMSPIDKWELQKRMFDRKMKLDVENPSGIFDRTLMCHLAYCMFRCDDQINVATCKIMMGLAAENLRSYDLLFYFPVYDWRLKDDDLRETGFTYRMTIDTLLKGLMQEFQVVPQIVPDGDPQDRADSIIDFIRRNRSD
jgi:hypothetical protein